MLEQKHLKNLIVVKFLIEKSSKEKPKWQWANSVWPHVLDTETVENKQNNLKNVFYWVHQVLSLVSWQTIQNSNIFTLLFTPLK